MTNTTKLFNEFITRNFQGLSAHTLTQTLTAGNDIHKEYAFNAVYVSIYHVFTGEATSDELMEYDTIRGFIIGHSSIITLDIGFFDLRRAVKWLDASFFARCSEDDIEYLKESALDWYLNGLITLNQFKLIVAM